MKKNILITGDPKSGKSTLMARLTGLLPRRHGLLTREVRESGERIGFEIIASNGETRMLANVTFGMSYRVSKYGVDPSVIDSLIPELETMPEDAFLYLDEIGQMQLLSERFRDFVLRFFDSDRPVVATLSAVYSDEFTESLRKRDDVTVVHLTEKNREEVFAEISAALKARSS